MKGIRLVGFTLALLLGIGTGIALAEQGDGEAQRKAVARSSASAAASDPPEIEAAAFRLKGTHGYSIFAIAASEEGSHNGVIELFVGRRGKSVSYRAHAKMTADTLSADLGNIGRVSVFRRPAGYEKTVHLKCVPRTPTYEPAIYEGVIEFNGEEGYTRARVTHVSVLPLWLLFAPRGRCNESVNGESSGPGEPGARIRGFSSARGRSLSFQVNKNSPRGRTVFEASLGERRDGIRISRSVSGAAPSSAFRFDSRLRTAALSPPAPFSGSAALARSKDVFSPKWTGDLALDFPGRSAVPLTGADVHVSLVPARLIPGSRS